MKMYNPAHPGFILKEYIEGMSVTEIAQRLGVSRITLSRVLNAQSAISVEMALRLSKLLSTSPNFWLNMQSAYDIWQLEQTKTFDIVPIIPPAQVDEIHA